MAFDVGKVIKIVFHEEVHLQPGQASAPTTPARRGYVRRKLQAIQGAAEHRGQRRRRVMKVAQRVNAGKASTNDEERRRRDTGVPARAIELCRPFGARHLFACLPRAYALATYLTRLTALCDSGHCNIDPPGFPPRVSGEATSLFVQPVYKNTGLISRLDLSPLQTFSSNSIAAKSSY